MFASGSRAQNDRAFVRKEQGIVQGQLDTLRASDPNLYNQIIGEVNSSLNGGGIQGIAAQALDPFYASVLGEVRADLGRAIDFANIDDRIAIGDKLTGKIRENSKVICTGSRIERTSC
jgi:hypothetical protein